MNNTTKFDRYPALFTRGIVLFPNCPTTIDVGREFSVAACQEALAKYEGKILITSQIDINLEEVDASQVYPIGVLCSINSIRPSVRDKGLFKVRVTALYRVKITDIVLPNQEHNYITAVGNLVPTFSSSKEKETIFINKIVDLLASSIELTSYFPAPLFTRLEKGISSEDLSNQLGNCLPLSLDSKQKLLETDDITMRIDMLSSFLSKMISSDEIDSEISKKVRDKTDRSQREYFLREKLKAIQDELNELTGGEGDDGDNLAQMLEKGDYPENIKKKARAELKRYEAMPQSSLEASMQRTYIEWLLNLPWYQKTTDDDSLDHVQKVLDEDHYGLKKVKERIVEYLAVKSVTQSLKAPILCLYGPPGVGKTSLAKSIARALGRKFVKASLGGVSDEAEIRGHRRTYVGAMPGKIIKGIKSAGVCNPVFLLDEVDKVASSNKGDPASALLEVLDPEQNAIFQDNYIEETYDLSNVLFIATANYLQNIPAPLRDRLELIELNSYTNIEKLHIAKEHLVGKQAALNGLKKSQIAFDDKAINFLIDFYTREAGVRELERKISSICRKVVVELLKDKSLKKIKITPKKIKEYLGNEIFDYSKKEKENQIGVVTGLAYTEFGGDILPIEVNYFAGKGGLVITGNLGNVMKESASIALDYVRANAKKYGIDSDFFKNHDIHIHVPEGAVPKDGPSAGIALTVAIISSITQTAVRSYVAMTGEVTLRGTALAIGGLKEKTLAALRSGIKTVVIPRENERNIDDLPNEVKENLKIILMDNVDQAIEQAFERN